LKNSELVATFGSGHNCAPQDHQRCELRSLPHAAGNAAGAVPVGVVHLAATTTALLAKQVAAAAPVAAVCRCAAADGVPHVPTPRIALAKFTNIDPPSQLLFEGALHGSVRNAGAAAMSMICRCCVPRLSSCRSCHLDLLLKAREATCCMQVSASSLAPGAEATPRQSARPRVQ
jgi:hypothetical protein